MKTSKKTLFIFGLASAIAGSVLGATFILSFQQNNYGQEQTQTEVAQTKQTTDNGFIHQVAMTSGENETANNSCNMIEASESAVESVVYVETHFVKEQLTYDPFMRLFYGEDAYKIRERRGIASGSGVIVSPEGYIVTNNHVVSDAEKIEVSIGDERYKAELVGTDPSTDLAVVKIAKRGLPYLEFGNSDELRLGEWVVAVGNPLNLQSTVTAGIVSAKNRNIDLLTSNYNPEEGVFPIESFIQTDAAVNSGNSGGALVSHDGKLVGINTAIASNTGYYTGYSFAIPSNIVKKVTYDLIKYGEVKRVQLGVTILDNDSDVASKNALPTSKGVVVTSVVEGGNADRSKIREKDIILAVEGIEVNTISELQARLATHKPGDEVNLRVMRGEEEKEVRVVME